MFLNGSWDYMFYYRAHEPRLSHTFRVFPKSFKSRDSPWHVIAGSCELKTPRRQAHTGFPTAKTSFNCRCACGPWWHCRLWDQVPYQSFLLSFVRKTSCVTSYAFEAAQGRRDEVSRLSRVHRQGCTEVHPLNCRIVRCEMKALNNASCSASFAKHPEWACGSW